MLEQIGLIIPIILSIIMEAKIWLILLFILPVIYKYSFWFYTIQLKEYRWDRFKEYILTPQWKKAVFNFWFFIELPLFLISFLVYFDKWLEILIFPIIFFFLSFYNIFVLGKIFRKTFLKPKITSRLIITISLFLIWFILDLYFIIFWDYWNSIYVYITWSLILAPVIIFFYILLTLPLVNFLKNRKIKKSIKKSEKLNDVIKIWITWSYGKSSVKEFLASILDQDKYPSPPTGTHPLVKGQEILLKTPENQNTEMSVSALVLNKLNNKFKYFVAEMWAYRVWEISLLWKIVNHKYWFLTAVWNQHLWLFGWIEKTKKGKFEILESVIKNNWILYVNWDNENILDYLEKNNLLDIEGKEFKIVKYWIKSEKLEAKSNNVKLENWKTKFDFEYKTIKQNFEIDLIWEHNVVNLTWVIACCIDLWLRVEDIKNYLINLEIPKNTLEIIKKEEIILIDDSYNLSENWLFAWMEVLNSYESSGEKILVMDDILELWKETEEMNKKIW